MDICQQGSQLNLENVSFSFDKNAILGNASVSINNKSTTLAEVDRSRKQPQVPGPRFAQSLKTTSPGYNRSFPTNSFAEVSVVRKTLQLPQYNTEQTVHWRLWRDFADDMW